MREFTATPNDEGVRLSRFVARVTAGMPTSAQYKAFRKGRVKVNGKRAKPDDRLHAGSAIQLYINDAFFKAGGPPRQASRQEATFTVVWQDENIAVLYKPAGVLCHSDKGGEDTLQAAFVRMLEASGEYISAGEASFVPALCNRLDRGTEGLLLAAKRYAALRDMNALIREGAVDKVYRCICVGRPPEGDFTAYLSRDKAAKKVTVGAVPTSDAKPIRTGIQVLEEHGGASLCEVTLHTGRTHQIRAHLAFLGAPVLGDKKYGNPAANKRWSTATQALCAHTLRFACTLPQDNTLQTLAGKSFTCPCTGLDALWRRLSGT